MRWYAPILSRLCTYCCKFWPVLKRVECDYSYWLGPDYKRTWDGAGLNVVNHVSLMDVVIHQGMIRPFTSFVGKEEAKRVPGIAGLCEACD